MYSLLFGLLIVFNGCKKENEDDIFVRETNIKKSNVKYSFFAAGHTYGSSFNHIYSMHTPFVQHIPFKTTIQI